MKPTEQLKEDHNAIKLMLKILGKVCERLESGQQVKVEHLDEIIEFIKIFSDKCHHGKEENLLFPAMEEAGIPREGGPIGVMLTEHNEGREYVKAMVETVAAYKAGDKEINPRFAENARNYIALLTQHIEKEENILYLMADTHIPEERQEALLEKFEAFEREIIGVGKHDEFHKLLHRLRDVYLE